MACCFSPADGNTILSGSADNTLKLWDVRSGVCRRTLTGHADVVNGCAFCPVDGSIVLSCSYNNTIKLWDAATGPCTATLEGGSAAEKALCFSISRDGSTIAGGDFAGHLALWRRV